MADKRSLSFDPTSGIRTDFIFEEGTNLKDDQIVIATSQDVTAIVKANKRSANAIDKHQKHGEWSKVASIPMSVYHQLKEQGITDDPARFKRWLNDGENKYFRTRGGTV
jgi:putative lipase involved disintegration of autophagic bodies|tara:strand:+ start:111 stop:437 length:327 start_codon:yes stop_codon:yes gene_type:complete